MLSKLVAGAVAVALALVAVLTWWLQGTAPSAPQVELDHSRPKPQGGIYTMALPEPVDLNPYTTSGAIARRMVLRYTHDALMEFDPRDGSVRPCLAEKLEVLDGGRRIRLTLRGGVRFADGTPMSVADVLFTYRVARMNGMVLGTVAGALQDVAEMRAIDARTIEVRLDSVTFASVPSFATGYIVGKRGYFMEEVARLAAESGASTPRPGDRAFVRLLRQIESSGPGTGPYCLTRWTRGRDLYLTQNPHSWRRDVRPEDWNLAGIRILFVQDPAACFSLARAGVLDLYTESRALDILDRHPDLAKTHRALVYDHRGNGHYVVIWNHRRGLLGRAVVRRALTMMFDREEIVRTAFHGAARRSRSWFRPGSANDAPADRDIAFDPEAARGLLDSAGVSNLGVEILFAASQPVQARIMDLAMPAFTRAGIELAAIPMEWPALRARLAARDFDGILLHVSLAPFVDPYRQFHASQIEGGRNWMGYDDPEVNQVLAAARVEPDIDRRATMFQRFNELFRRDQPVTLLAHPLSSVLLARRFQGVTTGPLGLIPEKWWVESR